LAQLVGDAPAFRQVLKSIPLIAASDSPSLLVGETGTGKEICARAIHSLGRRGDSPFVPVECGALPEHLVENELFGHVRGAFTDAHVDQRGLVSIAEGGTLFLDEIDALSLGAQTKLLRFLQDGTYRALGADRFSRANVRVLAATNVRLETYIAEKRFRSDLYYRLNVLRLELPPLRERRQDIGLLACDFLRMFCRAGSLRPMTFSRSALLLLEQHDWPGNIRELRNVVERAVVLSQGSKILPAHLLLSNSENTSETMVPSFREAREIAVKIFEKRYVERALHRHSGNVTRAAREAGKDRRDFGRLVKKYGIDRHSFIGGLGKIHPASGEDLPTLCV
jgi:DNA-binding NtrC family response regulator